MDTYDGWRGACIILAGVFLNMVRRICSLYLFHYFENMIQGCVRNAVPRSAGSGQPTPTWPRIFLALSWTQHIDNYQLHARDRAAEGGLAGGRRQPPDQRGGRGGGAAFATTLLR